MATNYKQPPCFDKETSFDTWKNKIEIWRRVTDLAKNKQALAVSLSLTGKARECAIEISSDELARDEGMTLLIKKLDSVFLKKAEDSAHEAYSKFDGYRKGEEVTMAHFIIEFEQLYN